MINAEVRTALRGKAKEYWNPEKGNASRMLAREGEYIDRAGLEWSQGELERMRKDKRTYLFGFDPLNVGL